MASGFEHSIFILECSQWQSLDYTTESQTNRKKKKTSLAKAGTKAADTRVRSYILLPK